MHPPTHTHTQLPTALNSFQHLVCAAAPIFTLSWHFILMPYTVATRDLLSIKQLNGFRSLLPICHPLMESPPFFVSSFCLSLTAC